MQRLVGLEIAAKAQIRSAQTANPGTGWTQLADVNASQVILYNNTGTTLRVAYCNPATGDDLTNQTYLTVADGTVQPLRGISTAKQVKIKRDDESNTQVTAKYVLEDVATL